MMHPLRKVVGYHEDLGAAYLFKAWVDLECGHKVYVAFKNEKPVRRRPRRCWQCTRYGPEHRLIGR